MMLFPHHVDNTSSASLCLLGGRRKPRGSEESIYLSPSHGETYQSRKPWLQLNQKEPVDLRGDSFMASVLRRLVYWSQKVSDFKPFIAKEKRVALQNRSSFYHGWFSRSWQELLEETMLCVSMVTFHRYLNVLVGWRWIQTRSYLENQGGRNHYRTNLKNLCIDLQKNSHSLPDFSIYEVLSSSEQENSENSKRPNINTNFASEVENRFLKGRNL